MIELFAPITALPVDDLPGFLGSSEPMRYPESSKKKPYQQWKMEIDDSPIFRYIYRNFKPRRHLEYGTWRGEGACYALEESNATVWTLNPPFGEWSDDGKMVYGTIRDELPQLQAWGRRLGLNVGNAPQTDNVLFIGYKYLERGFGNRVCQVYTDSREWDHSAYPDGFFDSCLIDGGHTADVVRNDTMQALRLVRQGGLIMWHDFCPDDQIIRDFSTSRGVVNAIREMADELNDAVQLSWIEPSFILLGVRR